mmetsp:Transcript_42662/g.31207  ORF Transcript_42662/g.31207 Transcript_42662/m.31207 type:complete len:118 (-) Transcript_42662:290-643(-)|eukprot:CAMPEP_0202965322 /NCGR_PEP_ID=MMETSP1396-20130829/9335_1 /ASSEMBLY_ACC=CAM_ASM_000872 /TAXON_ID= /ORGANISM="Pseudokeronopsis sp., Strain Brazil" /LENGTH=117 /DNA_ID=CAMNT_0049687997 /DNA_START=85 /DNA_END=438 /DNA_ORIENTATION=-
MIVVLGITSATLKQLNDTNSLANDLVTNLIVQRNLTGDTYPLYGQCQLRSYDSTYSISGYVNFTQTNEDADVLIEYSVSGLTANSIHGFHVHQDGDLSSGCTSLAGHYNPFGMNHGG